MVTSDDVRRVLDPLPRSYEVFVRGRWKFRVKQIVYVAFSADELAIGFGFPREQRDGLISSDPDTFFLPPMSDLRFQWVCAHLPRLDHDEILELVTDAWRMCVPKMLHGLPELPAPTCEAWSRVEEGEWGELRQLLDPQVRFRDREVALRGRSQMLGHLRDVPRPRPPRSVDVQRGRIVAWNR